MTQHAEKELLEPTLLCDRKGNLNPLAIGYARKPIITSNLKGHFMRKKKWNYWCVFGDEILVSATISHLDYAAVCFVYILEYETQRFFEKTITLPPLGNRVKMAEEVLQHTTCHDASMKINMLHTQGETILSIYVPDFDDDILDVHITIQHPEDDDSLNVVIPWNRQTFQFTAKHHTLPATGYVKLGEKTYTFEPHESFAVLDYGRGIWPRNAMWNWAMASQRLGCHRVGLNLGGQWTDGTGMTENAIFIDGHMTKIHEDVLFTYDTNDFLKPWRIETRFSNDVDLTFTPFFERVANSDAKLVSSSVHQLVGYYNGRVKLDNGMYFHVQQLLGTCEEHVAKW
ncbi:DUF2804 domain-containing protein [Kurthia massiliensis]|uniref:DUF2804 domain-containing protein n=1 Tax=Kurthia massiliensis TaxID=1033739 RepID=UPI000288F46D|nr:DUF2804 domain-containing protein [Kurthia massiliensis]